MQNIYELMYMSRMCDSWAQQALFDSCEYMIAVIVDKFVQYNNDWRSYREDMMQVGMINLDKAINTYRADRDCGIRTYVSVVVKRRLLTYIRDMTINPDNQVSIYSLDYLLSCNGEKRMMYDFIAQRDKMVEPEYYTRFTSARDSLIEFMESLDYNDRQVMECWMNGMKYKDAGLKLGVTARKYETKLRKLRQQLYCVVDCK